MPRVSVIIPAYNAAETIARTIASVLRQTFDDFEIVVVDDGSTDGTAALVAGIDDPRIRLQSYANGGLPAARNRGIAASRGNYLAFLDADDLWAKNKLESHVAVFERQADIGVVYSWTCTIDADDRFLGSHSTATWAGDVYRALLERFFVGNGSNAVVRREVVESVGIFDEGLDRGEDWEFCVRAAARWPFAVVPEYMVFYRWRPGSISSDVDRMRDGLLAAVDRMFEQAPAEMRSLKARSLANVHVYVARSFLTRRSDRAAVGQALRSLATALWLQPHLLLDPVGVRLCGRLLVALISSPERAGTTAAGYHRAVGDSTPKVSPWA